MPHGKQTIVPVGDGLELPDRTRTFVFKIDNYV
jgi:hypothetical protein